MLMAEHPWISPCLSRSCGNAMLPGRLVEGYQPEGSRWWEVSPPKKQGVFCLVRKWWYMSHVFAQDPKDGEYWDAQMLLSRMNWNQRHSCKKEGCFILWIIFDLVFHNDPGFNKHPVYNQRKFRLRNFRYTNNISVKLSQVEQVK